MAGEVFYFSDLFDVAATLTNVLACLYIIKIPVQLLTDSRYLFDVISNMSSMSEKRMMLNIDTAHEVSHDKVISNIGFDRISNNLADGLKNTKPQVSLQYVISSGFLSVKPVNKLFETALFWLFPHLPMLF